MLDNNFSRQYLGMYFAYFPRIQALTFQAICIKCQSLFSEKNMKTRVVRRQLSSPERANPICKLSLNIKDEMQNLNIAESDLTLMSEECPTEGYMPLKCLPFEVSVDEI